jgi:glutathione S-transferase
MSLVLYGAPLSPFVRKVDVFLREKGLPFESESVNILPMPDWFKEISPARRIPVLRDRDVGEVGRAGTLPDSSAICAYLERLHPAPPLYPEEAFAYGRALWYEEWADTELVMAVGAGLFRPIMFPIFQKKEPDLETARKTWNERLPRLLDYLEEELAGDLGARDHLVGEALSIADVAVACQLVQATLVGGPLDAARWPAVVRFYDATTARPSFEPTLAICRKVIPEPFDLGA